MRFSDQQSVSLTPLGSVSDRYLHDEQSLVVELAKASDAGHAVRERIQKTAASLVRAVRRHAANEGGLDAFLQQYDLSSEEGVLLMCIAEALLRIPDADTADRLIADKITSASWKDHLGESDSLFVNASTWGLMLTGQLLQLDNSARGNPSKYLGKIASRAGEPVVRTAMRQAMRIMGHQFVMGRRIEEALERSRKKVNRKFRYSFDMLGESALTSEDAARYYQSYSAAIRSIGNSVGEGTDIFSAPSISVKLSALHPRYSYSQHRRASGELVPILADLTCQARDAGIALTMDAEEADRLELSLEIFEQVFRDKRLADYHGFGLAVQAYQRRATDVIRFLVDVASSMGRRIPVRLVKGAYWDTEIKRGQEQGIASYPVFTRKAHTDVSYLACARQMFAAGTALYPQFATHNAHTLASVMQFGGSREDYEFQRLHGMGEELYDEVTDPKKFGRPCRVYAPVGSHEDLLPYLVRRLLENGANTSFVNRILDPAVNVRDIVADPIAVTRETGGRPHAAIPQPADLFQPQRPNSRGTNLADRRSLAAVLAAMDQADLSHRVATPLIAGKSLGGRERASVSPADIKQQVGVCKEADAAAVDKAVTIALAAQGDWDLLHARNRADILRKAADLFEQNAQELLALCVREAGKTLPDALSELREAVDFIRFYAAEAERLFGDPVVLPGPTGERNTLGMRGRGVFVCISPWNFPLAIFTGQVVAALAAGNAVLAKPAEQTPLVAHRAVQLLLEAGVPAEVLAFLPGDGLSVGAAAVADPRIAGVAFTGSTETARSINRSLAMKDGPIATLIAETGGLNAMFVDSSALPEQVVLDSVYSAFNSAGQRCSALRLLCVQEDIAPRVVELLAGYMKELVIGDPADLSTDVGPVIDADARKKLAAHVRDFSRHSKIIYQCTLPSSAAAGTFFAPVAMEVDDIARLTDEIFGPVLHVFRYRRKKFDQTVAAVNASGYGLTMGLHSRINRRASALTSVSAAGNIYINRNMIGAVVGVQPFGGRGLSGTGPKAGGPHYLARFGTEYTVSNNISAVGGNASLLSLNEN
ncbi:MAG: bifunctional proline dehydrogenase/L-glutamate gamma-semialdehyde dehydrogenase PutA [Gammaproteobacteria bacterium]|nr:bifunctional proline dehydrogenase/L-glutamate gamma-semialdehyde dehydrogenase PutA [Gammaproteobacteria bacterium]MDH4315522.1 bifunctional proline dehydrogenase/L-glutamate gamma-semialdehyde dehydrogenase PutA [Gammaproteobacteria bacterium]MDH5214307.1 bifunctional proline dehydrogenase/L-glutamate gamma-semialdehyde dehydrogenase PutA [Gammaproteobacteria bacterium]